MCGIIGSWWKAKPDNFESLIGKGLDTLKHRGPDDNGYVMNDTSVGCVFLGQTRLSIIDLSSGGHQPMLSSNGRYTIVFNGEIYNYREIRYELIGLGYTFKTESDTEVLLVSWEHWGKECLQRLVGMFAFCVFDSKNNRLVLVRDAFGIKPLFYFRSQDTFSFGSEIQSVMNLSNTKLKVNDQRVFDYLVYAIQDVGEDTFISEIHHVPPAHMITLDIANISNLRLEQWWQPSTERKSDISFDEAVARLRKLFLESIRVHLRSDVPLGIALSGGIDSSAIACAVRYLEPDMNIHTFSFIPDNSSLSEESWMDIINDHIKAIPHKIIVKSNELQEDIEDLIQCQGEPFCTTSMYAQYRVFELAKKEGIKVVLEGQGADEMLAGYQGYHGQRMRSLLEERNFGTLFEFAKRWKKWKGRENLSPWRALLGQLVPDGVFRLIQELVGNQKIPVWINLEYIKKHRVNTRPVRPRRLASGKKRRVIEVMSDSLINNGLPSLLRYGDRNAMKFSIENRVPFLTIPLAEFLLGLPEEYLISQNGETKSIFRAAMRGIVPDRILDRPDKVGFEVPMGKWVYEMKKSLVEINTQSDELSMINFDKLKAELTNNLQNNERMPVQQWRGINLLLWLKSVLEPHNQRQAC